MDNKTRTLILLCTIAFLDYAAMGLVFPLFSSMLYAPGSQLLGEGATEIQKGMWLSILLGAVSITQLVSSPVFGSLSDRYGRKEMLYITQLTGVAGYFIAAIAATFQCIELLLVSRIVVGVASGWSTIESAALSDISSPERKMQNFGYLGMASGLGFALGPYLGGHILEFAHDIANPFVFPFILAFIVISLNAYLVKHRFPETNSCPKAPISFHSRWENIKKTFSKPAFTISLAVVFFFYFGWSTYWNFSPILWISQHAYTPADVSRMYAYGSIAYAICSGLLIQPIVKRFPARTILIYSLFLCACTFAFLIFDCAHHKLLFYVPVQQYLLSLFSPTVTTLICNMTKRDEHGEMLGIFFSMHAIADALGPLLSSPLMCLDVRSPLFVGVVCMVLGASFVLCFMPKRLSGMRIATR